jgi:hypothetical protein
MISVVWIDQDEARVFELSSERMERDRLRAGPEGRAPWLERLANRLRNAKRILLLGRGVSASKFREWLALNSPGTAAKVVGCESMDEPSDVEIATYATRYFRMKTG